MKNWELQKCTRHNKHLNAKCPKQSISQHTVKFIFRFHSFTFIKNFNRASCSFSDSKIVRQKGTRITSRFSLVESSSCARDPRDRWIINEASGLVSVNSGVIVSRRNRWNRRSKINTQPLAMNHWYQSSSRHRRRRRRRRLGRACS